MQIAEKIVGPAFPIGDRLDTNIFDPETNLVASSTGEGTIDIVHEDSPSKFSVARERTARDALANGRKHSRPAALCAMFTEESKSKTHNLYVDTADFVRATPVSGARKGPQLQPKPGTFHLLVYGL